MGLKEKYWPCNPGTVYCVASTLPVGVRRFLEMLVGHVYFGRELPTGTVTDARYGLFTFSHPIPTLLLWTILHCMHFVCTLNVEVLVYNSAPFNSFFDTAWVFNVSNFLVYEKTARIKYGRYGFGFRWSK